MDITAQTLIVLMQGAVDARKDTESEMHSLRRKLDELEKKRDLLQQEEQGYRLAIARRFPDEPLDFLAEAGVGPASELVAIADDIVTQPRSDAVETAIRVITRTEPAASPAGIEEFLHERGRDDSRDAIGAAIAYLNRTNRVVNVSRGQWRLAGTI